MSGAGAAALGVAAGIAGGVLAVEGARRLDDLRQRRQETRDGDRIIVREPGRTFVRENDRVFIQRDETERFRDLGADVRTQRSGDGYVSSFDRPNGDRIITYLDENGRLLRRVRRAPDGDEVVIIDNRFAGPRPPSYEDYVVVLPPPPLPIPRDVYVVDAGRVDERYIYETLIAPPVAPVPRRYTLDQVRYSVDLRARMRSVDIDTINFDSGSWTVSPDQSGRLSVIARAIRQALQRNPNEVFLVEGYTDAVGGEIDNLSLSDRRAQSVAEILTRDFGVPPENLTTQGYGEAYLKIDTQDASRENRRVAVRRITPLLTGQNAPR